MAGLPAEGEDLLYKLSRPHCRFEDIAEVSLYLGTVGNIFRCHLGKTQDGCEDVVEVMGDASGEGADGFHLLGLAELVFDFLALFHLALKRFIGLVQFSGSFLHAEFKGIVGLGGLLRSCLRSVMSRNTTANWPDSGRKANTS